MVAGVGGDAHSVGLIVLRGIIFRAGFRVQYLGTQVGLAELCEAAAGADAVLVSNMDGHARVYLRDLPNVQATHGVRRPQLWYLGGHPSLHADAESIDELRALGFDRVFPLYVRPAEVIATLDEDLGVAPSAPWQRSETVVELAPAPAPVRPVRVPARRRRSFAARREEVLAHWHTGAQAADLEDNAETLLRRQSLSAVQRRAGAEGRILIHPRTGVALTSGQLDLFRALQDAGADVLSFQIDSLTRNNSYEDVELALKQHAQDPRRSTGLNGYPAVNHGVAALRAVSEEFRETPLQVRHSTRDPRLLAEISFAGGVAAFEGGPITYNLPYYRDYPPADAVEAWRYVDELAGLYASRFGVGIDREFFGVLTASLMPPCLAVAVNVLEAMLSAEHGVTSVSLGYAEQGHRLQDIAAVRSMSRVAAHYLGDRAPGEIAVHTVFHQYMGAFPEDLDLARQLLHGSAVTAALSGATRLMLKTYVEAVRIPSAEENVASLQLVRAAIGSAGAAEVDRAALAAEEELVCAEATAIVDACLRAGRGRVGAAVVAGIDRGYLDIPFSPSLWNRGRALAVRDLTGAVRFADPGRIPLPAEVAAHHRRLVDERRRAENGRPLEELLEQDVLRVADGSFDRWPLG